MMMNAGEIDVDARTLYGSESEVVHGRSESEKFEVVKEFS